MREGALTATHLRRQAQLCGYRVLKIEQPRANRWVLTLCTPADSTVLVLVQVRSRVSSADVHDLADLVGVRRLDVGIVWAYSGSFTAYAEQACRELRGTISLVTELPRSGGA